MSKLQVYAFASDWGLPTVGPFALKLFAWLGLNGVPFEHRVENNPAKGPLGKSPWIVEDGRMLGDSDAIIAHLSRSRGVASDQRLSPAEAAAGHAWKRCFEEHFHQVLEWELFVHPDGAAYMRKWIRGQIPPVVGALAARSVARNMARQLHARGIGRHDPETVAAKGRADLDGFAAALGGRDFLGGDRPSLADLAVFGQVAPLVHWPMPTPVARHAKETPEIVAFCERIRTRCLRGGASREAGAAGRPVAAAAS